MTSDRDRALIEAWDANPQLKLRDLGGTFNVTAERARQILAASGRTASDPSRIRRRDSAAALRVVEEFDRVPTSELSVLAYKTGLSERTVRRALDELRPQWKRLRRAATRTAADANAVVSPRAGIRPQYSLEEMLAALRRCAQDLGYPPSRREYDEWKKPGDPSGPLFPIRFGSWSGARKLALEGGESGEL